MQVLNIKNMRGPQYFITFIDDYSCYAFAFLSLEKSEAIDVFEKFANEV